MESWIGLQTHRIWAQLKNSWKRLKAKITEQAPKLVDFKDNEAGHALLIHTASVAWDSLGERLLRKLVEGM